MIVKPSRWSETSADGFGAGRLPWTCRKSSDIFADSSSLVNGSSARIEGSSSLTKAPEQQEGYVEMIDFVVHPLLPERLSHEKQAM
jgi:hypothetical protein